MTNPNPIDAKTPQYESSITATLTVTPLEPTHTTCGHAFCGEPATYQINIQFQNGRNDTHYYCARDHRTFFSTLIRIVMSPEQTS